jgi:hypothetical protein
MTPSHSTLSIQPNTPVYDGVGFISSAFMSKIQRCYGVWLIFSRPCQNEGYRSGYSIELHYPKSLFVHCFGYGATVVYCSFMCYSTLRFTSTEDMDRVGIGVCSGLRTAERAIVVNNFNRLFLIV